MLKKKLWKYLNSNAISVLMFWTAKSQHSKGYKSSFMLSFAFILDGGEGDRGAESQMGQS